MVMVPFIRCQSFLITTNWLILLGPWMSKSVHCFANKLCWEIWLSGRIFIVLYFPHAELNHTWFFFLLKKRNCCYCASSSCCYDLADSLTVAAFQPLKVPLLQGPLWPPSIPFLADTLRHMAAGRGGHPHCWPINLSNWLTPPDAKELAPRATTFVANRGQNVAV